VTDRPIVLFVCVHNAGRSQMAAGYLEHLAAGRIEVRSAGSAPADRLNPAVVAAMAEEGIDITARTPRLLAVDDVRESDVVITMGCGDACPVFPGKRYEDWELDDPAGRGIADVRAIRDGIRSRVESLIASLTPPAREEIMIRPIRVEDAGQVLTVQRAAFVTEALIYDSPDMGPLTQTLAELEYELRDNLGYVAVVDSRIVGAARAVSSDDMLLVGRIAIAPDQQGAGIGPRLLGAVEERGAERGCRWSELFTGSLSADNLALYEKLGYRESERIPQPDGTAQIFLRKPLDRRASGS